ncbi:MAG: hypothetical protein LC732_01535 [Acidobacteria bacterium]|nr:hypothetical protein [Acidobacteriota bacterium]
MGWMLTCREMADALSRAPAERWGVLRKMAIRLHLMMCGDCRRYAAQMEALGEAARDLCSEEQPRPELEDAILESIRRQSRDGGIDPGEPRS